VAAKGESKCMVFHNVFYFKNQEDSKDTFLDPFDSALTRSFGKRAKAPLRVNPEQTKAVRLGSRGVDNSGFDDY